VAIDINILSASNRIQTAEEIIFPVSYVSRLVFPSQFFCCRNESIFFWVTLFRVRLFRTISRSLSASTNCNFNTTNSYSRYLPLPRYLYGIYFSRLGVYYMYITVSHIIISSRTQSRYCTLHTCLVFKEGELIAHIFINSFELYVGTCVYYHIRDKNFIITERLVWHYYDFGINVINVFRQTKSF